MNVIFDWVRNIVIFLILNTIIMNLLGNSSYKKYVSIVSGMILLLIVVSPFLKLLNMDEILDYYLNTNIFQSDMSNFQSELRLMEDKQKDVVFAGFKDNIREQVAEFLEADGLYLYELDVVFNQSIDSNSFGEIESLEIKAGYIEDEGLPVNIIHIDKINISNSIKDKNIFENNLFSPEEIQIKKRLSDFYKMKQDNINISIQGDNVIN